MSLPLRLSVLRDVYEPSDDSFLLMRHVPRFSRGRVLDVGTGCGIQAIAAAEKAERILATDINPHALECARENAKANGVLEKIEFRKSDLFERIGADERFDLIVFNPPYLPTTEEETTSGPLDAAWNGGRDGRRVIDRFLRSFARHLAEGGELLLLHCDLADTDKTVRVLRGRGFEVEVLEEQKVPGERLSVLLARRE